jgi:hypothetical protein
MGPEASSHETPWIDEDGGLRGRGGDERQEAGAVDRDHGWRQLLGPQPQDLRRIVGLRSDQPCQDPVELVRLARVVERGPVQEAVAQGGDDEVGEGRVVRVHGGPSR